jgi:hypothetical protein
MEADFQRTEADKDSAADSQFSTTHDGAMELKRAAIEAGAGGLPDAWPEGARESLRNEWPA